MIYNFNIKMLYLFLILLLLIFTSPGKFTSDFLVITHS
ncbi:unnamed protein product [Schistosoma margrebowiei]|uniref:Uncharacterized protein n=1 Tax=Schistosoma margrebowiei TaxID=48269 RepID=A0A183L9E5_9TREM|nr:unnamed protein product [Schistosoma margrebowiei]